MPSLDLPSKKSSLFFASQKKRYGKKGQKEAVIARKFMNLANPPFSMKKKKKIGISDYNDDSVSITYRYASMPT